VKARGNCVYIQIPLPTQNTTLRWELDYTYPVLPKGYNNFLQIMYQRLIAQKIDPTDYNTIMTPLLCEQASAQEILFPSFDACFFNIHLNVIYYKVQKHNLVASSIGPTVIATLSFFVLSIYVLVFFRTH
jgi:hypothetical protein